MDWDTKAKKYLEQKKQREEEERDRKERKRVEREEARERRSNVLKLAWLQVRFRCHICGALPTRPKTEHWYVCPDFNAPSSGVNWNEPGNLSKCSVCGKWTCDSHLHQGICERDLSTM
jgi:hypothetical protein